MSKTCPTCGEPMWTTPRRRLAALWLRRRLEAAALWVDMRTAVRFHPEQFAHLHLTDAEADQMFVDLERQA